MATIRLVMEKYVDKNYDGCVYSFNGHHAKWFLGTPKNPLYEIFPDEKDTSKTILMGCEPNTIVKLCRKSYNNMVEFERNHQVRLVWSKNEHGYIVSRDIKNPKEMYPMEKVITGSDVVEHVDGDPLNNKWDNLRVTEW